MKIQFLIKVLFFNFGTLINFLFLEIIIPVYTNLFIKFLALSSLIGLAFLSKETQATTGFDLYISDVFSNNKAFLDNNACPGFRVNQGLQNLGNNFGLIQNNPQSYNNIGYQSYSSNNLKKEPE